MPPPKSAFRLKNFCFASRLASALAAAIELFDEIAPAEEELSDHVANPSSSIWLFDADVDGADLAPGAQGPTRDKRLYLSPRWGGRNIPILDGAYRSRVADQAMPTFCIILDDSRVISRPFHLSRSRRSLQDIVFAAAVRVVASRAGHRGDRRGIAEVNISSPSLYALKPNKRAVHVLWLIKGLDFDLALRSDPSPVADE